MEKEEYPVKVDDEIYGPIPIDRIINDVKNGELSKDATFLDNGDWIPVTLLLEENIPITPWNEDNWVDSKEDLLSSDDVHLTIRGLNAGYGKMEILHNFDLTVGKAQSLCLIGPNGAGKSTILHSIYGFTNIFDGKIELEGNEITKLTPAQKLNKVGIAYILQDNSVFPDMTVEENLLMGGYIKDKQDEAYEEAERIFKKYERLRNRS